MKRAALTVLCAVAAAFCGGCNRTVPTFTVEELLANAQDHSHTLVKVRGCFALAFEKSVLQPCKSQNQVQSVWVEQALVYKEIADLHRSHPEFKGPTPIEFLFDYDKARERRAWKELEASLGQDQMTSEIVLFGQFETIAPDSPGTYAGFGHLDAYAHELILVDVFGSKPNTAR